MTRTLPSCLPLHESLVQGSAILKEIQDYTVATRYKFAGLILQVSSRLKTNPKFSGSRTQPRAGSESALHRFIENGQIPVTSALRRAA
jgi:hypothetical protein